MERVYSYNPAARTGPLLCVMHGQRTARPMAICRDHVDTDFAYSQRDGQAKLTWMAGYVPRWSPIPELYRLEVH